MQRPKWPGEGEGIHAVPCGCRPRGYCHLCLVGLDASSGEPNAHMLSGKPDLKNMGQSIINYGVSWDVPGSTGTWSRQNHVSNVEHLCPCARVCVCVCVCHDCACVSFRREFLQRMRKQHDILTAVELLATQLRVSFLFHSATAQEFGPAEEATSTAVR